MIIYHDDNLQVSHVITYHDPTYDPKSNGQTFIVHDDHIPHDQIHLTRDDEGAIQIARKQTFPITSLTDQILLGHEATFLCVPEGTSISVNGESMSVMDESGTLELTPDTTGFFKVLFTLRGYMDKEIQLEVVSGN